MVSLAKVGARLGQYALALFALAACGGSVVPSPGPEDHSSGGGAGDTDVPEMAAGASNVPEMTAGGAGGSAGTSNPDSGGQMGTTPPSCVPGRSIGCACSSGESGAQKCLGDGTYGQCVCSGDSATWDQQQLSRLRQGMVGTWTGMQTNPWDSGCATTITFEANGNYSAHSPDEECTVFYYGSNEDSSEKTYLLNDVLPTAEGQGEIVFWFNPGNTNAGHIRHLELSPDDTELKFEAWKADFGPLVFTLKRVGG